MKKIIKWLGIIIIGLVITVFSWIWIASEPLPKGNAGAEAEALAQQIMKATGQEAWDSTRYIRWNFADRHQFIWDRDRDLVQVDWPGNTVQLYTENQQGKAWENGTLLEGKKADKKLAAAWKYFCNDSFWLNAPGKFYDPGTTRKLVTLEDGTKALLVTYGSGGVTPGDSYLWFSDEQGMPVKWKMWVSILPIGGIEASWSNWQRLSTGGMVATQHTTSVYKLTISDIQAGNDWQSIGLGKDPFEL